MTESKVETHFDKGARILNAVIAEVDISADLKGSAQSVISMLAELLPQLLAQPAAAPASAATSRTPGDLDDAAWFNDAVDRAMDVQPASERVGRSSRVKPARAATRKQAAPPRAEAAAPSAQQPLAALAEMPEADVRLIWNAYEMVQGLQRSHAEQLNAALIAALRARTDPARVVELMISASSGSARLWRAALDDLAKA
jgi:hypothetical protein